MFDSTFSVTKTVVGAALMTATMASAAEALPVFTLNPSTVGLNSGGAFTADNIIISDYSTITITPDGKGGATFTDTGVLPVAGFQLGSSFVDAKGLNTTYGLYFGFDATGTQNTPTFTSTTDGKFTSLNYTLFGYNVSGPVTYKNSNTTPTGVSSPIALATGTLIDGGVGATTVTGQAVPNANTLLTFTPTKAGQAMFVNPNPFYNAVFSAFTNNPSQVQTTANGFIITQGGGSANFFQTTTQTPEPASMALVGAGLLGLGVLRRRNKA